ncbi:MAG: DUF4139 domain-containing protein [Elusimicrobia bacterium]|nr:DUF4139 domain-containing protein [Elusimicrobiota bacterium]
MRKIFFIAFLLVCPILVYSASVTVYNDDFALVRDVKEFELNRGAQKIEISDVASKIDPTSVLPKFVSDADKISILEQNYDYDLVNSNKLLQKYIGKEITVERQLPNSKKEQLTGTLLAVNGGIIIRTNNEKIIINPEGEISLSGLPEGLMLKPTISWLVDSKVSGKKSMELSYKTSGFSWNADYVAVLDKNDKNIDLNAWVTINNISGATYKDADLKLVAGDVNTVKRNSSPRMLMAVNKAAAVSDEASFEEQSFFEYHIYNLSRKTTLKDNEKKQIELTSAQKVPVEKKYIFNGSKYNGKVEVVLVLKNNKESNLGIPLPKGKVRVFKNDGRALEFVGEDKIEHTPEKADISLSLGNAFDVTAEKMTVNVVRNNNSKNMEESIEFKVKNSKDVPVKVEIVENLNAYSSWKIISSSEKYIKKNSNTIIFNIEIPAKAEKKIEYKVKYSW